jgi:PleD family two-component response regulator
MPPPGTRPPQLLVASNNHGPGLELFQLAERRGFTTRRAPTGAQLLEQAHAVPPDLVVLDEALSDMDTLAASRALRDDPHVGPGTPLLVISTLRPSSPQHHAALRSGVWEFLRHPFNAEEIGAKLDSYVLFKRDSDRARRDASIADATGFYTVRGLALRAQELTLQAFHHAQPLACVALAPVTGDGEDGRALDLLAGALRATGRRSDAMGRVGPGEFAVIAPGTDRAGAVFLAERLARAVTTAARAGGPEGSARVPGLRAGYDAVGNARYTPIEPKHLLARATTALRAAKGLGGPNWIQGFTG